MFVRFGAGCPMYGDPAEHLKKPEKHPVAADKLPPPPPEQKYIDECPNNFHDKVMRETARDTSGAKSLVGQGDTAVARADQAPDTPAKAAQLVNGIQRYSAALVKDPYDANATLQLAIAYDRVYRKGCALAMLRRLASMTKYPAYRPSADSSAAKITDNPTWFKAYRSEAITAAGI
jgi:hypothetical protein